jgi:hypothetical protein
MDVLDYKRRAELRNISPRLLKHTSTTMATEIPRTQTAAVVTSKDEEIQIKEDHPVTQVADLAPGECLIKMEATGICHTGKVYMFSIHVLI